MLRLARNAAAICLLAITALWPSAIPTAGQAARLYLPILIRRTASPWLVPTVTPASQNSTPTVTAIVPPRPTASATPTVTPPVTPTATATVRPSSTASASPTITPATTPTATRTPAPTATSTGIPTATRSPTITRTLGPPPPPSCQITPGPGVQVSAHVSDEHPSQHSNVTVYGCIAENGGGLAAVSMHTVWHYKTTDSTCDGTTASSGVAYCTRDIGSATLGYRVTINVSFSYAGTTYRTSTSFTPH